MTFLLLVALLAAAEDDVAAARATFEKNLDAIRHRDREAYLSVYLNAPTLARTGFEGFNLGYEDLQKSAGENWPTHFEGTDLRLVPVQPGVVYGTYRYRVRYGDDEQTGISERLFVKTPEGWKIAVTTAFAAPPGTPPPPRALVGATLVDGTGRAPIRDAVVIIRGGRIDCAGTKKDCPVPDGVSISEMSGMWIAPGLIDAHVHFSQTGWADGRPDALDVREKYPYEKTIADRKEKPEQFFRSYICSGVTGVFDVGGYPFTIKLTGRAENDTRAPHVAAAGPLLSTRDHWLNLPAERQFIYLKDEASAREGVRYLASQGADSVKVWYIAEASRNWDDMAAAVRAAGDEARKAGLPLIVHATELKTAKAALEAGAHLLVHSVWDAPVDDEFLALARRNQTIYNPTLTVQNGYTRLIESVVNRQALTIDDPNGCVDEETLAKIADTPNMKPSARMTRESLALRAPRILDQARIAAANLKRIHDAGITVAMGTDAGNPLTVHGPSVYAEMEAMQAAGMTPMQVLVASTRNAAMAMRREKDIGTVEKGKVADLIVVAGDPTASIANLRKLKWVVRGGVVRGIEELRN